MDNRLTKVIEYTSTCTHVIIDFEILGKWHSDKCYRIYANVELYRLYSEQGLELSGDESYVGAC